MAKKNVKIDHFLNVPKKSVAAKHKQHKRSWNYFTMFFTTKKQQQTRLRHDSVVL